MATNVLGLIFSETTVFSTMGACVCSEVDFSLTILNTVNYTCNIIVRYWNNILTVMKKKQVCLLLYYYSCSI